MSVAAATAEDSKDAHRIPEGEERAVLLNLVSETAEEILATLDQVGDAPLKAMMEALGVSSMDGALLVGVDLRGEDLSGISFVDANLTGADLSDCNLSGCDFSRALLVGTKLAGARAEDAKFANALIISADPLGIVGGDFSQAMVELSRESFRAELRAAILRAGAAGWMSSTWKRVRSLFGPPRPPTPPATSGAR